jgi:F-type H+-transporting ATPase subunit epsilon
MDTLKLSIVTPQGKIFDGSVNSVTLPGKEGEFGVFPGHVALVSLLSTGIIEVVKENNEKESVLINWGHVKVNENSVDCLVDDAVAISGKDDSEIAGAINDAKNLLNDIKDSNVMISVLESKIEQAAKGI